MSAPPSTSQAETVRDAIARADELAADGRYLEAIDVLNAANRVERDGELESRLVLMRCRAFDEIDRSYGWPWEENEAPRPRPLRHLLPRRNLPCCRASAAG